MTVGFLLTAILGYRANYSSATRDIENLSMLVSEDIYHQQSAIFAKPVSASRTMADDVFLKDLLEREGVYLDESAFANEVARYLSPYHERYGYDSVFLVSASSSRYYSFEGYDRTLEADDPENEWYFKAIESRADYLLEVDNDQVSNDAITVFVNCRVVSERGTLLGLVGVGLRTDELQSVLAEYGDTFGADVYLVGKDGTIELSRDYVGYDKKNLFDLYPCSDEVRSRVLSRGGSGESEGFWIDAYGGDSVASYMVVRYLPDLDWHLVVERDTGTLVADLRQRFVESAVIIAVIAAVILGVITHAIGSFNTRIVDLARKANAERRSAFERATEDLFDHIYELDITNNRPANEVTERYFESLGAPKGTPFDKALAIVAEKQIKAEYRQGYIDTFTPESVLDSFAEGRELLRYEFMISDAEGEYYWMRITARIVWLASEGSVHMLSYRQNIDDEKREEHEMIERVETDEMTGLLTKATMARRINEVLVAEPDCPHVLYALDIDGFKGANDEHGHLFGDAVIVAFGKILREQLGEEAVIGRFGGDEFAAFVSIPDERWAEEKGDELVRAANMVYEEDGASWRMTASAGFAVSPRDGSDFALLFGHADAALYVAKRSGKNRSVRFGREVSSGQVGGSG